MTVVVISEKFVHGPRLLPETFQTKVGEFGKPVLATVAPLQYLTSPVLHFSVDQPNQRFLTVNHIAAVSALGDETYGIG